MKLRNRTKENSKRPVDDENEEDVDDPEVDSDSDPEWGADPEAKNEMFSMKRKSFVPMPLQMQQPPTKIKKIEPPNPTASKEPLNATASTSSETPQAGPSGINQKSPATVVSASSSTTTPSPTYKLTNQTMVVKDKKGGTLNCPFKVLTMDKPINVTTTTSTTPATRTAVSHTSSASTSSFANGDFIKDISKHNAKNCIWQVDGMNLLQKFIPVKDEKTGKTLYKSSFTYDGLNAMNSARFQKVQAVIVNKIKNETFVQITEELNPLEVNIKPEPISDESVTSTEPDPVIEKPAPPALIPKPAPPVIPDAPSIANYKNTFKDDFVVFLQALISQCLDPTFLRDVYSAYYADKNEQDGFFVEKIKVIDDVLEAKKFSLMSLPTFPNNERILYAIHTYPVAEEKQLPAIKMENFNCVVCAEQTMQEIPVYSNTLLELKGEPYERNTLLNVALLVDVDEDLKVLRVCTTCCKILKLYSKMCHSKYLMYKQCEKAVLKIREAKKSSGEFDLSEVVTSLLANEPWVETKLLHIIRDWVTVDDLKKET